MTGFFSQSLPRTALAGDAADPAFAGDGFGRATVTRRLIVTIDGPAGTGKSSVARELARRLGLDFLDTGAMYRAAAALAIDSGTDPADERAVADLARRADLRFDWSKDPPELLAMGAPIMHRLRDPDVTALVSPVSQFPMLRRVMVERQRRIAEVHPRLVSEGRDQGSVVFHDASVKIYLDASPRVRAQRRAAQLHAQGVEADLSAIEAEISDRDRRDMSRLVGPLVCPDNAERLDTSQLSQTQVVDRLVEIVQRKTGLIEVVLPGAALPGAVLPGAVVPGAVQSWRADG